MRALASAVGMVWFGIATIAVAAVVAGPSSDEELVAEAGYVLTGTVERVEGQWSPDGGQIYSFVDIRVGEAIKGTPGTDVIRLRVLGGEVDGFGMQVVDGPTFVPGEEAVFFLERNPQTLFPLVGLAAGKVPIVTDATTRARSVPGRAMARDAYVDRLRAIVAAQALGAGPTTLDVPLAPKAGEP